MLPAAVAIVSLAILSGVWLTRRLARIDADPADLNFLGQRNLYALHVLRIIDSADYRHYAARSRRYRRYLFRRYARCLKQDMAELSRLPTDAGGVLYRRLFAALYAVLLLKSGWTVGASDLRALLGVELRLIRRLG